MRMKQIKAAGAALAIVLILLFAFLRVHSATSTRPSESNRIETEIFRSVQNASAPHLEIKSFAADADFIRGSAIEAARASLLSLAPSSRPSREDADAIAKVFAEFLLLNRVGSPEDAIQSYLVRNVPVPRQLKNEDPAKREKSWAFSTAWSRQDEVDLETIASEAKYIHGKHVGLPYGGATISASRPLRSGNDIWAAPHNYTAYDVSLISSAPNIDHTSVVKFFVHITIVNDRPYGGWDVIQASLSEIPLGKVVLPPLP